MLGSLTKGLPKSIYWPHKEYGHYVY